jgi:nicotinamidase-related amidase
MHADHQDESGVLETTTRNTERIWSRFLTPLDRQILERGYYGRGDESAFGTTPCLLIVDVQKYLLGDDRPILEQIDRYPSGIGDAAWRATERIASLLQESSLSHIAVAYSRMISSGPNLTFYGDRVPRDELLGSDHPLSRISELIVPSRLYGQSMVFDKYFPSAFFATPLNAWLIRHRIDTLLLAGGSTSGCVRATAVDGASLGYKVVVIEDATFDRLEISHAVSLLDIWMKYGAVKTTREVSEYVRGLIVSKREA